MANRPDVARLQPTIDGGTWAMAARPVSRLTVALVLLRALPRLLVAVTSEVAHHG